MTFIPNYQDVFLAPFPAQITAVSSGQYTFAEQQIDDDGTYSALLNGREGTAVELNGLTVSVPQYVEMSLRGIIANTGLPLYEFDGGNQSLTVQDNDSPTQHIFPGINTLQINSENGLVLYSGTVCQLYMGGATGGTFTITVGADTTSGQGPFVSTSALQTAVQGLASVGSGNCIVTSTSTGFGAFVTYQLAFPTSLGALTVSANTSALTGGTGYAFTTLNEGVVGNAVVDAVPASASQNGIVTTGNQTWAGIKTAPNFTATGQLGVGPGAYLNFQGSTSNLSGIMQVDSNGGVIISAGAAGASIIVGNNPGGATSGEQIECGNINTFVIGAVYPGLASYSINYFGTQYDGVSLSSFTTLDGQTATIHGGIITSLVSGASPLDSTALSSGGGSQFQGGSAGGFLICAPVFSNNTFKLYRLFTESSFNGTSTITFTIPFTAAVSILTTSGGTGTLSPSFITSLTLTAVSVSGSGDGDLYLIGC